MADTKTTGISENHSVLPWELVLPLEVVGAAEETVRAVGAWCRRGHVCALTACVFAPQASAIYNALWAWFGKHAKSPVTILCPETAKQFYDKTSSVPWPHSAPPTEKDLDPTEIVKKPTHLRGYAVTSVVSRNAFAAARMANAIGFACKAHADYLRASANAVQITPTVVVPVTAVPAVVGKNGSAISALEAVCGLRLFVLPIGDTVGTHAIFAAAGAVITQYQWLTIAETVQRLEVGSWKSVAHRPVAVGNTYRVKTHGRLLAHGAPLLLVRVSHDQLIWRETSGSVHACSRHKRTFLAQV
jgi:hypothetical protein